VAPRFSENLCFLGVADVLSIIKSTQNQRDHITALTRDISLFVSNKQIILCPKRKYLFHETYKSPQAKQSSERKYLQQSVMKSNAPNGQ
jgi:hypothetical protein